MSESILIAGLPSEIRSALIRKIQNSDRNLIVAKQSEVDKDIPNPVPDDMLVLNYNPSSFLSARSLFIECRNRHITINHVFLVYSAESSFTIFNELRGRDIERKIDVSLKNFIFLLKESIAYFETLQVFGSINIILYNKNTLSDPLDAALKAAIEALTKSVVESYNEEQLLIRGFRTNHSDTTDFLDYIQKIFDNTSLTKSGKWYTFRKTLLSQFRSLRQTL